MYYTKKKKTEKKSSGEKKKKKSPDKMTLVRKLDKIFSMYIRLRDSKPYGGKYFKCISCGQIKAFDQMDCGHYFSRKHMATRFNEDNCHGECRGCNRFSADHLHGYQTHLIEKIGRQRFNHLIVLHNTTKKFTEFELQEMIKYYSILVKSMQ